MKVLPFIILLSIFLAACSSPEKLLKKGDYDALVEKSIKNLIKNPNSEEDAILLDKAYNLANDRDLERIKYLKTEANPDTWDEILSLFNNLKNRQTSIKRVLPLHINGRSVQYNLIDYDTE